MQRIINLRLLKRCLPVNMRKLATSNVKNFVPLAMNATFQLDRRFLSSTTIRFAAHQPFTLKTVEDRIILILSLYDKIDPERLTMDSDFFKDLGLDSLDFVEVIVALEDEFNFEIPDGDSDRFKTPRDVSRYICDKYDVYE